MIRVVAYTPAEGEHGVPISVRIDFSHQFLSLAYVRLLVGAHPVPTQVKELALDEVDADSYGRWQLDASAPPFHLTGASSANYTVTVSVQALDEHNNILDTVPCGEFTYWVPQYSSYSTHNLLNATSTGDLPSATAHLARKRAYTLPSSLSSKTTPSHSSGSIITNRSFLQRRTRPLSSSRSQRHSPDATECIHTPVLDLITPLETITSNWSPSEAAAGRRLVVFNKVLEGSRLIVSCEPISQDLYDSVTAQSQSSPAVVSCIYRDENDSYYATSVDIIYLLERLVDEEFPVEEKNRIRRNLEGLRPTTVSKHKPGLDKFFSTIMDFPDPKPRNIEKDLKVFEWSLLGQALEKIISKYSVYSLSTPASHTIPSSPLSFVSSIRTPVISNSTPALSTNDISMSFPLMTKTEDHDVILAPPTYLHDDEYANMYPTYHSHDQTESSDSASASGSSGPNTAHWGFENGQFAAQQQMRQSRPDLDNPSETHSASDSFIGPTDSYHSSFDTYDPLDYSLSSDKTMRTHNTMMFGGGDHALSSLGGVIDHLGGASSFISDHHSDHGSPVTISADGSVPLSAYP